MGAHKRLHNDGCAQQLVETIEVGFDMLLGSLSLLEYLLVAENFGPLANGSRG